MTIITRQAIVPYTPAQMYHLVDNMLAYPEFLPWCASSKEEERTEDAVVATLVLSFKGIQKSFTTRNLLQPYKMIELHLVNGPFKHLHGCWTFEPLGESGCKIACSLEFEFSGHLLSMAFGKLFEPIAANLVNAFTQRAVVLYG